MHTTQYIFAILWGACSRQLDIDRVKRGLVRNVIPRIHIRVAPSIFCTNIHSQEAEKGKEKLVTPRKMIRIKSILMSFV